MLGTGAAVADINNDGVLELLISHGETAEQPLSLFSESIKIFLVEGVEL